MGSFWGAGSSSTGGLSVTGTGSVAGAGNTGRPEHAGSDPDGRDCSRCGPCAAEAGRILSAARAKRVRSGFGHGSGRLPEHIGSESRGPSMAWARVIPVEPQAGRSDQEKSPDRIRDPPTAHTCDHDGNRSWPKGRCYRVQASQNRQQQQIRRPRRTLKAHDSRCLPAETGKPTNTRPTDGLSRPT
jgi:hypothetical protein